LNCGGWSSIITEFDKTTERLLFPTKHNKKKKNSTDIKKYLKEIGHLVSEEIVHQKKDV